MAVPACPGARFVLIRTGFLLEGLEAHLDSPAHVRDLRNPLEGRIFRVEDEVIVNLAGIVNVAPRQEPLVAANSLKQGISGGNGGLIQTPQAYPRPVENPLALSFLTCGMALPRSGSKLREQLTYACRPLSKAFSSFEALYKLIAGDPCWFYS